MVMKDYPPTIWCNDEVYVIYLEFLDRKAPPMECATLSIETLISYSDKKDIRLPEVFTQISIQEVIHLLRVRRLSPWLLLFSKTFKSALVNRATDEQRIILENLIRPSYWPDKFQQHPDEVVKIKMLVNEMGI